jgi:hypothetical protein
MSNDILIAALCFKQGRTHMNRHPVVIVDKLQHPPKRLEPSSQSDHPPPEEYLGGGDICSPEEQPSTDDDKPLD